jgi:glycine/D-amino acid oxidase-like deaminating enzyme
VRWRLSLTLSSTNGFHASNLQVHPKQFTEALFAASARLAGTVLREGIVEQIVVHPETRAVVGVLVDGEVLAADVVVVAMGPWSAAANGPHLTLPPVYGQKYHSVLMRPGRVLTEAVFIQGMGDPEIYPRPDGDVYVTGFPDDPIIVTEIPGQVCICWKTHLMLGLLRVIYHFNLAM